MVLRRDAIGGLYTLGKEIMIEVVDDTNLEEVLPLIRQYLAFYNISGIDDEKNARYFSKFGPSTDLGCLFAYRLDGQIVGFATVYFSYASSILSKVAIMNDLYTTEAYRRRGIGKELIMHCERFAREHGAARLQWVTAATNTTAQAVYNSLGAKHSTWEIYTYTK